MTGGRDLDHEMKRFGLDDQTVDRLLSGQVAPQDAPPGYQLIADAIRKAAGSSPAPGAARETATVAAVVEALRSNSQARQLVRRRSMLAQLLSAKVAAIAAVTVLGATAAAAATNTLPDAAQTVVSDAVSHVGVSVPKPNGHANAHATAQHGKPDNPGKSGDATGPDATGSAKYGLCTAYAAGPTSTNPHSQKNSSVAFSNLQKAADDAGMSVADFCKDAAPQSEGSTGANGPAHETGATGAPNTHSVTPSSSGRPASTPPVSTPASTHGSPPASTPPVSTPDSSHASTGTAHRP
jgi:hypothetical protein